ncbi:hypothetical protein FQA39_LY17245 [Lamprigera yunnana]|nr:hypothetical protein FQA39_LY17245 [Lamprigera yunnana]
MEILNKTNNNGIKDIPKLTVDLGTQEVADESDMLNIRSGMSTPDSEEIYYTPPGSPMLLCSSSDEDSFKDSVLPEYDVFMEGNVPTKTDYAVYNAVRCIQSKLNPQDYPYVYKWCHSVKLLSEQDQSWLSPRVGKYTIHLPLDASTPEQVGTFKTDLNSSNHTWIRITGTNSPRSSAKYSKRNLSFNL